MNNNKYILITKKDGDSISLIEDALEVTKISFDLEKSIWLGKEDIKVEYKLYKIEDDKYFLKILNSDNLSIENKIIWTLDNLKFLCSSLKKVDELKKSTINIAIHWGGETNEHWDVHTAELVDENNKLKGTDCFFTFYSEGNDGVNASNLDKLIKLIEDRIKKKTYFIRKFYALKEYVLFNLYPLSWALDVNKSDIIKTKIINDFDELLKLEEISHTDIEIKPSKEKISEFFAEKSEDIIQEIRNQFDQTIIEFFKQYPEVKHIYG